MGQTSRCALSGRGRVLLIIGASLLLLAWNLPAFRSFFIGEDFEALGWYKFYDRDLGVVLLSPMGPAMFRPVAILASLPVYALLPRDPLYFHALNYFLCLVNIILFSAILNRLGVSQTAHVLAVLALVLSKIHLTLIGYIALYGAIIIGTCFLLCTLFFFLRFIESRRPLDYALSMAFCGLCIFSRDANFLVVGVLAALVWAYGIPAGSRPETYRQWALRLAPPVLGSILYLALRPMVVALPPASHPTYGLRFSLREVVAKIYLLISAGANVSFTDDGTTGAPGLGRWLTLHSTPAGPPLAWGDVFLGLAWVALLVATTIVALRRGAGRILLFPFTWVVLFFAPMSLIGNRQLYYMYLPLLGLILGWALGLDRAGPGLKRVWGGALMVIAANGIISNYTSSYHWQFAARQVEQAYRAVRALHPGPELRSITFITRSRSFWRWALATGPLLPYMLRQENLMIRFIDYSFLRHHRPRPDPTRLFIDVDNGFVPYHFPREPLVLRELFPSRVKCGEKFNVQPNGRSALAVKAENATPGTLIVMSDRPLATTYGDPTFVTAFVPEDLLTRPGTHAVYLTDGVRESNRLDFVVIESADCSRPMGKAH